MRFPLAAALFCAVLGLAPAARAQAPAPAPFVTSVGDPIAYRIDMPGSWEITRQTRTAAPATSHALVGVSDGDKAVAVAAVDLVKGRTDRPAGVSEAGMRRMVTERLLGSDSLMYGVLEQVATSQFGKIQDPAREIRTLAGQRAAYLRGRIERSGMLISFEAYATVRDGISYVFTTVSTDPAAHEPLFARIRDSLVLAPAPR